MTIAKSNSFLKQKKNGLVGFRPAIFGEKFSVGDATFIKSVVYPINEKTKKIYNPEADQILPLTTDSYYMEIDEVDYIADGFDVDEITFDMLRSDFAGSMFDFPSNAFQENSAPSVFARVWLNYFLTKTQAEVERDLEGAYLSTVFRFVLNPSEEVSLCLYYQDTGRDVEPFVQLGLVVDSTIFLFKDSGECVKCDESTPQQSLNGFESPESLESNLGFIRDSLLTLAKSRKCPHLLELFEIDPLELLGEESSVDGGDSPIIMKIRGEGDVTSAVKVVFRLFDELNSRIVLKSRELGVPTKSSKLALLLFSKSNCSMGDDEFFAIADKYKIPRQQFVELISTVFDGADFTKFFSLSFSEDFEDELEELRSRPEMTAGEPIKIPNFSVKFVNQRTIDDKVFKRICKKYLKNMNEDYVKLGVYLYYCVICNATSLASLCSYVADNVGPSRRFYYQDRNIIDNIKINSSSELARRPIIRGNLVGSQEFLDHLMPQDSFALEIGSVALGLFYSAHEQYLPKMLVVNVQAPRANVFGYSRDAKTTATYEPMSFSKAYSNFNKRKFLDKLGSKENSELIGAFFEDLVLAEQEHPKSLEGLIDDFDYYRRLVPEEKDFINGYTCSSFNRFYLWDECESSLDLSNIPVLESCETPYSLIVELYANLLCGFKSKSDLYGSAKFERRGVPHPTDEFRRLGLSFVFQSSIDVGLPVLRVRDLHPDTYGDPAVIEIFVEGKSIDPLEYVNERASNFTAPQKEFIKDYIVPVASFLYFYEHRYDADGNRTVLFYDAISGKLKLEPLSLRKVLESNPGRVEHVLQQYPDDLQPIIKGVIDELLRSEERSQN